MVLPVPAAAMAPPLAQVRAQLVRRARPRAMVLRDRRGRAVLRAMSRTRSALARGGTEGFCRAQTVFDSHAPSLRPLASFLRPQPRGLRAAAAMRARHDGVREMLSGAPDLLVQRAIDAMDRAIETDQAAANALNPNEAEELRNIAQVYHQQAHEFITYAMQAIEPDAPALGQALPNLNPQAAGQVDAPDVIDLEQWVGADDDGDDDNSTVVGGDKVRTLTSGYDTGSEEHWEWM